MLGAAVLSVASAYTAFLTQNFSEFPRILLNFQLDSPEIKLIPGNRLKPQ
jgi:hypothetical protein